MRKTLIALTAGAMILGGAAIAMAQTDDATTYPIQAMERDQDRDQDRTEYLADMVGQGVITQEQADTLAAEMQQRFELRRAEREQRRAEAREHKEGLEAAFSDDVLTVAELEELGAVRILDEDGPFAEALEDGELTRAEFDAIHETLPCGGPGGQRRGGPGGGPGSGFGGGNA